MAPIDGVLSSTDAIALLEIIKACPAFSREFVPQELVARLKAVADAGRFPQLADGLAVRRIAGREREVLRWTRDGKSTREIAAILNIGERTVKYHLYNAMAKLDAVSKAQAVAVALKRRVINFD